MLGLLQQIEESYDEAKWKALLQTALIDAPVCVVVARPSAAQAKTMSTAEDDRIAAQVTELGADKLAALGQTLVAAVARCDSHCVTVTHLMFSYLPCLTSLFDISLFPA